MKRSEQPARRLPPAKPEGMRTAGLYGEIAVLPVNHAASAPIREAKSFL